jgi:hypothetical protein
VPRAEQAEYQRVRWSLYLETQFATGGPTRAKFADALEVPTSRVSQWLASERGVEAQTAFAAGEVLRDAFGLLTSGSEALYAAGCFADVLRLLREAAMNEGSGGIGGPSRPDVSGGIGGPSRPDVNVERERVVALYCMLPRRFLASEVQALAAYPRAVAGYRENEFERHEAARLRRDAELLAARGNADAGVHFRREAEGSLASVAAVAQFRLAWQRAQRPLDLPRVVLPRPVPMPMPATARARESPAAPAAGAAPAVVPLQLAPVGPPPAEAIAALSDVVIALARALESRNPTLTAPRLWRMLAEWAFELAPAAFERYAPLLPETYAH